MNSFVGGRIRMNGLGAPDLSTPESNGGQSSCSVPEIPLWKRGLDISCIAVFSPLLLPLGFALALLIKCVSNGPVLFKQQRIGFRGRRFMCLKFRTMHVNAETAVHADYLKGLMASNGPMVKLDAKGDKRVIRFGGILRSTGVDEMPQLLNVLRGEMSLVGPRPCIPYEYENFPPQYRSRCDTLPGLTGWWQVNGKNRTSFERMMQLDLEYVRRKSLSLDLLILAKTIPAILRQVWDTKIARRKHAPDSARAEQAFVIGKS